MITAASPFRHVCRISREKFATFLHDRASPAVWMERDPGEYWQAIRSYSCDPLLILAMFWHESQAGNKGMARITRSWGNTRPPSYGVEHDHIETAANGGQFSAYNSWLDGCVSTVARLMSDHHAYAGRQQIGEIFDHPSGMVWAPAGDNNDPAGYLNAVLTFMNDHADRGEPMPVTIGGAFASQPKGIILHGSRSGKAGNPIAKEFAGTSAWASANPDGLGWNATIGANIYTTHIDSQHWGHNAREHSDEYLAVEFSQPTVNDAIGAEQVAAFAAWYRDKVHPVWPGLIALIMTDEGLPSHAELPAGIRDGKTDTFPKGDSRTDDLRGRLRVAVTTAIAPPAQPYQVGLGVLAAMDRAHDTPAGNERYIKDEHGDVVSVTAGNNGLYFYSFDTDSVYRVQKS